MTIWANIVKRFRAPALPLPTRTYDAQYFDKLLSVLRIYFNQLDNLLERIVDASSTTVPVSIGGTNVDAFGRLRTSAPYTLFDSQNRYAVNDQWSQTLTGSATAPYSANKSTVEMTVTAASGDEVVRQTYRSFSYQPGKSLLVMNTFVMPAASANQRIRIGYFNTQNGVFLERDGTAVYITRRTYVTGVAVDTRVAQADWNGDKLNGTGVSALTLDLTKAQIFWQDFEWLGVGSVRCGFIINGEYIVCHTFQNANNLTDVYMTTAILPVRYEITNTGASAGAVLKQICSTVISEGGYEKKVALDVARRTAIRTVAIADNWVPLVSLRLASGRTGAVVIPDGFSVLCVTTPADYEIGLFKNPPFSGAPTFATSGSANVDMAFDGTINNATLTTSMLVQHQYGSGSNQSGGAAGGDGEYNWNLQLGATIGGTSDVYTLAVKTISGTEDFYASLSFWDLT